MRERRIWLWPEIVGSALLALAGTAWGQEFNITGLRTDSVTLYRDCKMEQPVTVTKQQFEGQKWAARKDPNSALYFLLVRDNVNYCVKAFSVSTDQTVKVDKDSQCNARVAGAPPKSGAVRGVGEGCGK
ncbi:MAG TPA: hypothetical protein VKN16_21730 [Methylomirabilota bacterium]|jgi:hypothetical protein|nr:hypothetical protein [Methylomirabilota bacterium]